jgi:hypothetical protein
MRDDLNAILSFIGSESLTDDEFDSIDLDGMGDRVAVYQVLLLILESREAVSDTTTRLQNYFLAEGTSISGPPESDSNIFVGSSLE